MTPSSVLDFDDFEVSGYTSNILGVSESAAAQVKITPNPFTDALSIQLGGLDINSIISMYDPLGRQLEISEERIGNRIQIENLEDKEWTKKLYVEAERKTADSEEYDNLMTDLNELGDSIFDNLGDKEWTKKVYMLAEDKGEYSGEFWCLADCIFNKLGDKEWAVKVYKKAEESADSSDEFENLAESVRENLGDKKTRIL